MKESALPVDSILEKKKESHFSFVLICYYISLAVKWFTVVHLVNPSDTLQTGNDEFSHY